MAQRQLQLSPDQGSLASAPFSGRLFLEGPAGAGKTTAAAARLLKMLQAEYVGNSILVLAPQRTLLLPYERALSGPDAPPGGRPELVTFGGLARRMVDLFWPLAAGDAGFAHPEKTPVFLTLETAQYYLARLMRPMIEEQRLFDSVTMRRDRLYSQVLDNLNKAAVVGFHYTEIGHRLSNSWAGEPGQRRVYEDVQTCAAAFRKFCLDHNLLDFSLQIEVFRDLLWPLPICRNYLTSAYQHLIYDNIEEDTPVAHDLLIDLLPGFESALLIMDWQAGYRRFLGADPISAIRMRSLCEEKRLFSASLIQGGGVRALETRLDRALSLRTEPHFIFSDEADPVLLSKADPAGVESWHPEALQPKVFRFYPEMLDWVAEEVARLVKKGLSPGEIVVLAPYFSDALRFSLIERMDAHGVPVRSHRPSRSLRDEPPVKCLLTLAALAHPDWGIQPTGFDVAFALVQAVRDMDLIRAQILQKIVYHPKAKNFPLSSFDQILPQMQERITYRLGERYEKLRGWLREYSKEPTELDYFFSRIFGELLTQPEFGFYSRYDSGQATANLIESVRKFRWVVGPALEVEGMPTGREYLLMVEEGMVAAQYLTGWQGSEQDAVLLAPAYTFLMENRPVEAQFWLDVGSRGWVERLFQPLTHPYVLSRLWPDERAWSEADEYAAGNQALRRLAVGLLRRCRKTVFLGLSELNEQGYEQRGPLLAAFQRLLRESAVEAPV